jgi:hypothetical protein
MTSDRGGPAALTGAPDAGLEARLRAVWRAQQAWGLLRLLAWLAASFGALTLASLALDWPFDLPPGARAGLLAADLLGLLAVLAWAGRAAWVRFDPLRIALRIERRFSPELESILVSYVQFSRGAQDEGTSGELRALVCRRAPLLTGGVPFAESVPFGRLRRVAGAALAAAVVLVLLNWVRPGVLAALYARLLDPWSDLPYPTLTVLEPLPGDLCVKQGDPAPLKVKARGWTPETGALFVQARGGPWEEVQLARDAGDEYGYVLRGTYDDLRYYFRIGDARSPRRNLRVIPPPRVVSARVELHFPQYTGLGAGLSETLNLRVPEGTRVEWRLTLDREVSEALVAREGRPPEPIQVLADAKSVEFSAVAGASSSYSFRWREREHGFAYESPKYFLQVTPDRPPLVEILFPREDEKATLRKKETVLFRASDDHGFRDAAIVYRVNEGDERRLPVALPEGKVSVEQSFDWNLAEVVQELKEGDIITYALEARDRYPGKEAGHCARTDARRVQILSPKDYLAYVARQRTARLGAMRALYRQERSAHEAVKSWTEP